MSDVVWGVPHGRATHRLGAGVGCKSLRISNTCSGRANTRTQGARGSTVPLLSRERVRLILAMRSAKTGAVRSPRMRSVRAHTLPLVDSPLYTRAPRAHGTKFHAAQRLPPWQGHGGGRGARIVSAAVVASHALVPRQARTRPRTPLARWPGNSLVVVHDVAPAEGGRRFLLRLHAVRLDHLDEPVLGDLLLDLPGTRLADDSLLNGTRLVGLDERDARQPLARLGLED